MKIDYTKTGAGTVEVAINVEPEDYKEPFEKEVKDQQKKINLKGFRKGRTPRSLIQKMYGESILSDIVTKQVSDALNDYIEKENIKILGQPLPMDSSDPVRFEVGKDLDYKFEFEMGLLPEFELPELTEPFHYYDTVIDDETIDTEIEALRRRAGHQVTVESDFENEDIISFNGWELENGEVKNKGLEVDFTVMVERMDEDFQSRILDMKVGDTIDYDIYKIEKNLSEEEVKKYLMELDDDEMDEEVNAEFRLEIVKASRQELAEMDEEFFKKVFGDEVSTEEEARELIRKDIKQEFDEQADRLLFREINKRLMDEIEIDLPGEFLKRWLKFRMENENNNEDEVSEEEVETQYEAAFKNRLKRQVIMNKFKEKYDITVGEDEVVAQMRKMLNLHLPPHQRYMAEQLLPVMMQNENQVQQAYDQISEDKIFSQIKEELTLDKEVISHTDFNKKLTELSKSGTEEMEKAPFSLSEASSEEE